MIQANVYAFLVANTSLTYRDIRDLTDQQIADLQEQFRKKH